MISFYAGNTLRSITERILNELPRGGDEAHIVLVPDRYTLAVERAVAAKVGASLNIDVLTFARLAVRVLGQEADNCLSPEGCTMLLSKALYRCRGKLRFYGRVCDMPGFANEMYSSLVAVRESGIQVGDLMRAAEGMRGRIKEKTQDLALIYGEYLALLSAMDDPTTRLEKLAERICDNVELASAHIYVVDFYCFNEVQYKVIRELMKRAKSVHIGYIAEDVGKDNRRIYPSDLRNRLRQIASEEQLLCQTVLAYEPLSPHRQMIQDGLFGYNEIADNRLVAAGGRDAVRLFRAQDVTSELREVCAEICTLLRQGYRYRDFAIVCAGGESYDAAFRAVFAEYGIPLFRDAKVLLSDAPVVRYLLDVMEMERQRFSFDSVMKVVKNVFFSAPSAEVDCFENYCLKYNIAYNRFLQPFTLADKYDDMACAERMRNLLVQSRILSADCKTVGDYVDAIERFMEAAEIDARFKRFYERQRQLGYADDAKRSEQVPARLRALLALTRQLIGEEAVDIDGFMVLMRSSLESVRIGLPPQSVDCVYIGEAKDSHYDRVKVMFVVGAEDGVLPEIPTAGSILSDAYHAALQAQNLVIYPSTKQSGRYAMFYLEQLLLLAEERLYVSFCAEDVENEKAKNARAAADVSPQQPVADVPEVLELPQYSSLVINSLSAMFHLPVTDGLGHPLSAQIANRANAYKMLLRMHQALSPQDAARLYAVLLPADRRRYDALFAPHVHPLCDANDLFFYGELTSISQLETYFRCPYRHFVQYGLRAKERKEGGLDVRETGDVLHKVLELFFRRNAHRIDEITPEKVNDELEYCLSEVLSEARYQALNDSERSVQLMRLRRESFIIVPKEVELAQCSMFKPAEFEVVFGKVKEGMLLSEDDGVNKTAPADVAGSYPAIPLGNGISLSGKVDRIDRRDNEYIVIDYKSGAINIALSEIYMGLKIQLYAYLGALKQQDTKPVGAFYKRISGAYQSEKGKGGKISIPMCALRGHPIDDTALLQRIDPTISPTTNGEILTVKKSGRAAKKAQAGEADEWTNYDCYGTLLQYGQLKDIMDYVRRVMQKAVAEIRDGYIEAKPKDAETCKYCMAYDMCPNARHVGRKSPKVTLDSFAGGDDDE